jgi:Fic family protein
MQVPLNRDAGRDAMPALFDLLREEPHGAVRVVLGHFIFVYIHPCMDGNGRVGRFLINTMMASGGYPWTVTPVTDRNAYVNALEKAQIHPHTLRHYLPFLTMSCDMEGPWRSFSN